LEQVESVFTATNAPYADSTTSQENHRKEVKE
jgi:hypothetical protein